MHEVLLTSAAKDSKINWSWLQMLEMGWKAKVTQEMSIWTIFYTNDYDEAERRYCESITSIKVPGLACSRFLRPRSVTKAGDREGLRWGAGTGGTCGLSRRSERRNGVGTEGAGARLWRGLWEQGPRGVRSAEGVGPEASGRGSWRHRCRLFNRGVVSEGTRHFSNHDPTASRLH